jgi:hypothetical protein
MSELESAQQKHLGQIPQAQLIADPTKHDLEDNVGRQFEVVEWSPGSLIRFAPACPAAENGVAEFRCGDSGSGVEATGSEGRP